MTNIRIRGLRVRLILDIILAVATAAIRAHGQTFQTLMNFDENDGQAPIYVSLIQGTDGALYGTTALGGVPDICGHGSLPAGCGTIFEISLTGRFVELNRLSQYGHSPSAGVIQGSDGNFYGTTEYGGVSHGIDCGGGCGTVFRMTPEGVMSVLHNFSGTDGGDPLDALVEATDGNFYGTASRGGGSSGCYVGGCGTIFRVSPSGTFTNLHIFQNTLDDGALPNSGLIQGSDGNLYGTAGGGSSLWGIIYRMTLDGTFTIIHNFDYTDGGDPNSLIQGSDGNFYGTTTVGGTGNCFGHEPCGTVFKATPDGTLTTLFSFNQEDGAGPTAGLIQATDGNFYGTTTAGGLGYGTVFSITPTGDLTTLHTFDSTDGSAPYGGLIQATNGTFYGVTEFGGSYSFCSNGSLTGCGTVFSLSTGLGPFVKTQPTSGEVGGSVEILGTDLTGAISVTFNGTPASFQVGLGSLIETTVPDGATTGPVQVVAPGGTLTSNANFQVLP
jgi:uncharacterized repeat protein (TIGR03803 family)